MGIMGGDKMNGMMYYVLLLSHFSVMIIIIYLKEREQFVLYSPEW